MIIPWRFHEEKQDPLFIPVLVDIQRSGISMLEFVMRISGIGLLDIRV